MTTIVFYGQIYPMVWDISVNNLSPIKWKDPDLEMHVNVSIQKGKIVAECDVPNYDEAQDGFRRTLVRVTDIVRTTVNLIAFRVGAGLTVTLDRAVFPDNNTGRLIVLRDRTLESRCKSFRLDDGSFDEVARLVLTDARLYHAFRDLIEAITLPNVLVTRCASAIETIRTCMSPTGTERRRGWAMLQSNLNVGENFLKSITDHSRGPRHGDHHYIPGTTTEVVANNAWIVMDRYLEYLKRGKQPLPVSEFPLLA